MRVTGRSNLEDIDCSGIAVLSIHKRHMTAEMPDHLLLSKPFMVRGESGVMTNSLVSNRNWSSKYWGRCISPSEIRLRHSLWARVWELCFKVPLFLETREEESMI